MVVYVDIDGTICSQEEDYSNAKPYRERIQKINKLYDDGNEIIYWTARS
jgi:hydroxymethylpyrimidine pyrophosphatase-like HAD family hydrolase